MADSLLALTDALRTFARVRAWDQFHTPKNLAMALTGEVGELVAELQWVGNDQPLDGEALARVGREAADVLIYLVRFADVAGLDLLAEATRKLQLNEERYPVDRSYGNSAKRTRLIEEA